jgi:hypothetical protein
MSQRAVENTLGRLITDAAFRKEFLASPMAVCREFGVDLTTVELNALLRIDLYKVESLAGSMDRRIVRSAGAPFRGRVSLPREKHEADATADDMAHLKGDSVTANTDAAPATRSPGRRRESI